MTVIHTTISYLKVMLNNEVLSELFLFYFVEFIPFLRINSTYWNLLTAHSGPDTTLCPEGTAVNSCSYLPTLGKNKCRAKEVHAVESDEENDGIYTAVGLVCGDANEEILEKVISKLKLPKTSIGVG